MVLFQQAMLRICMDENKIKLKQEKEKENKNEVKSNNIITKEYPKESKEESIMSPKTKHNFIRNKSMDNFMKYSWTWTI